MSQSTGTIVVKVLGNPYAHIGAIRIHDNLSGVWYNVFPEGEQAYCKPGAGALTMNFGVQNIGGVDGNVWLKCTRDDGVVLINYAVWLKGDGSQWQNYEITTDMLPRDVSFTIEIGH